MATCVLAPLLASIALLALAPAAAIADGQVTLSPAAGAAGTSVVLQGSGFPASRHVAVGLGAASTRSVASSRAGAFRARLTIPRGRNGRLAVVSRRGRMRVVNTFFATRAGGARNVIETAPPGAFAAVDELAATGRVEVVKLVEHHDDPCARALLGQERLAEIALRGDVEGAVQDQAGRAVHLAASLDGERPFAVVTT